MNSGKAQKGLSAVSLQPNIFLMALCLQPEETFETLLSVCYVVSDLLITWCVIYKWKTQSHCGLTHQTMHGFAARHLRLLNVYYMQYVGQRATKLPVLFEPYCRSCICHFNTWQFRVYDRSYTRRWHLPDSFVYMTGHVAIWRFNTCQFRVYLL